MNSSNEEDDEVTEVEKDDEADTKKKAKNWATILKHGM